MLRNAIFSLIEGNITANVNRVLFITIFNLHFSGIIIIICWIFHYEKQICDSQFPKASLTYKTCQNRRINRQQEIAHVCEGVECR